MKVFYCSHCGQPLFFENTECVTCGHRVAYLPDLRVVASLDPDGPELWRSPLPAADKNGYRVCHNDKIERICNWAIQAHDQNPLCVSCRTTKVIPNLATPSHRSAWYQLEVAKRRLLFTLIELGLPLSSRADDPRGGLTFEFLADVDAGRASVLTGHDSGVITINVAEADDVERERRRQAMGEPYRTLLGHMRHESGHYYWDHLVGETPALSEFRSLFDDERRDYAWALGDYYQRGAPYDWQARYVSAYASAHPWEDWAETWAHYLHMVDALETATAWGLTPRPQPRGNPDGAADASTAAAVTVEESADAPTSFDRLIEGWFPLTYVLNNLNRGLGLGDAYPFALSATAVAKLRFVDAVIRRATGR